MMKAIKHTLALAMLLATMPIASAQLLEAQQTIFGMDCAPCAFGMERGLKSISGVTDVKVSLNHGTATLKFAEDNAVTVAQIRSVVRRNGFVPKDTYVRIVGRLAKTNGHLALVTGKHSEYRLLKSRDAESEWARLEKLPANAEVVVRGRVAADAQPNELWVAQATLARPATQR